jgi:hypothetical protein
MSSRITHLVTVDTFPAVCAAFPDILGPVPALIFVIYEPLVGFRKLLVV